MARISLFVSPSLSLFIYLSIYLPSSLFFYLYLALSFEKNAELQWMFDLTILFNTWDNIRSFIAVRSNSYPKVREPERQARIVLALSFAQSTIIITVIISTGYTHWFEN